MIRTIALMGAATLLSASLAIAQTSSSPESTAGGAQGTTKQGVSDKAAPKKGTTGVGTKGQSSPESTAGGAAGTSKDPRQKN